MSSAVNSFYASVITEVVDRLRSTFQEDGMDQASLQDLKEIWERKLKESGALDPIKQNTAPPAMHFTNIMQNEANRNPTRITNMNNSATTRLIKPSNQGNLMPDTNFNPTRLTTVPVMLQGGSNFRSVPMVINHGQQPGNVTFISPYHNIIPQQNTQPQQQYITENGIVNLRKSQFDGEEDDSSDDDKNDFITVGQDMEPQFIKNEEDPDDDEDLESSMPDVIAKDTPKPQEESSSDDNDNDVEDQEEEPLNTDDDISDDDPEKIFDCDNVIVCQFDKVNRTRNKWKLNFVSGIANLEGRDSVFHKAVGEAEW